MEKESNDEPSTGTSALYMASAEQSSRSAKEWLHLPLMKVSTEPVPLWRPVSLRRHDYLQASAKIKCVLKTDEGIFPNLLFLYLPCGLLPLRKSTLVQIRHTSYLPILRREFRHHVSKRHLEQCMRCQSLRQ